MFSIEDRITPKEKETLVKMFRTLQEKSKLVEEVQRQLDLGTPTKEAAEKAGITDQQFYSYRRHLRSPRRRARRKAPAPILTQTRVAERKAPAPKVEKKIHMIVGTPLEISEVLRNL